MRGDFSRNTFDISKHFSRVLQQQGRVQLDADPNEQAAILLHYLQVLAADLIGPHGGPGDGFKIDVTIDGKDFEIHDGHYYVDGMLCENHLRMDSTGKSIPVTYLTQPDPPFDKVNHDLPQGQSLVYLDVWERYMSYLSDDSIREKALGGPDTAGRAKIIWQVKVLPHKPDEKSDSVAPKSNENSNICNDVKNLLTLSRANLSARVRPEQPSTDPCIVAPDSKYRGAENRLYRVEIHTGGQAIGTEAIDAEPTTRATFKWSRDNGSVAAAWLEGDNVTVSSTRGFAAGQWVELTDDTHELQGKPGTLVQITKVEGEALTFNSAQVRKDSFKNPIVRGWDQMATEAITLSNADKAVPIHEGKDEQDWIDLEDGIQIQFQPAPTGIALNQYRTGDFWLIPARTATGAIEWPLELDMNGQIMRDQDGPISAALLPHGIKHHYAPLAVITLDSNGFVKVNEPLCRREIKQLTTEVS